MTAANRPSRRQRWPPIVRIIGSCAFCDSGAMISHDDISEALDADRGSGLKDPTPTEALLMIQGDNATGVVPPDLCAQHPALDALLTREMT